MNFDRDFILREFKNETADNLADVEAAVLVLENPAERAQAAKTIMRKLHNIKGGAAVLSFDGLSKIAHAMEDCLEPLRPGTLAVSKETVRHLLAGVDLIKRAVEAALAGNDVADAEAEAVLVALARSLAGGAGGAPAAAPAASEPAANGGGEIDRVETVRVEIAKLDSLLDLVTELTAAQARVNQLAGRQGAAGGEGLVAAVQAVAGLQRELQDRFMRLRLVPIGPLFHSFSRPTYEMADRLGKNVKLEIEGEDVEVDVSVFTLLRDPLTHIIRNAVDHGLETAAERQAAGKMPVGALSLKAAHSAGWFIIEIADDGRGLDRAKILARARARGLVEADAELTDEQIEELIFMPGFSTAEQVTEVSGRGVGMDVVRRNIEALRGSAQVAAAPGRGTKITIRLPLTLAIMDGFVVQAGVEHYVVPLAQVVEVLEFEPSISTDLPTGVFSLRGEAVPYIRVAQFYGSATGGRRENVVVVQQDGNTFGLVVEELLGEMQVVIKPLNKIFDRLPGISGTTILGDGRVALLLGMDLLWSAVLNVVSKQVEG